MPKLTYKEAAHRLRMTVSLLKWCERYAPKKDGQKLKFTGGLVEEADLIAFDSHLKTAWPSRALPTGIRKELHLEAAGQCGVCGDPCEHFEEVHIDRLNKELKYYCQHPHDLILLCGGCHGRYDRGSTITNAVVRKRKDILLSRLMEDVDRDMAVAKIARDGLVELHRTLAANAGRPDPQSTQEWIAFTASVFATGTTPADLVETPDDAGLGTKLEQASRLLVNTMPVTSGTLRAVAEKLEEGGSFAPPTEAEAWEFIEPEREPGECLRCGQQTPVEEYTCPKCDHWGTDHHGEVPVSVDRDQSPPRVEFEDARRDSYALKCEKCGSTKVDVEFQSLCDYCRHMTEKAAADD